MIDKITIQQIDVDEHAVQPKDLPHHFHRFGHGTQNSPIGRYKNMRLFRKGGRLKITGSLTRFGYGSNAFNADRYMTQRFLEQLVDDVCIPPTAVVTELEIGFNIPLSQKVSLYLGALQYAPGYKGIYKHEGRSVTFIRKTKRLRLYDKTEHFRQALQLSHLQYPGNINLLRYEVVLKEPARALRLKGRLTVAHLLDEAIITKLLHYWLHEFTKIIPHTSVKPCFKAYKPDDVYDHLMRKGIEGYGGTASTLAWVNTIEFKKYTTEYRKRVRDKIMRLSRAGHLSHPLNYVQELQNKVTFTAMHYLSSD